MEPARRHGARLLALSCRETVRRLTERPATYHARLTSMPTTATRANLLPIHPSRIMGFGMCMVVHVHGP